MTTTFISPGRLAWFLLAPVLAHSAVFIAGADFSHLKFFEDRGIVYRDAQGARDALEILRDAGLNCVRLRLFTSSAAQASADPYNSINNLDYTLPLAGFDQRSFFDANSSTLPIVRALGQLTKPVRLNAIRSGAGITLTWPLSGAGMVLTSTPNLPAQLTWTPVEPPPQPDGLAFRTTLLPTDPSRLYRLESN